MKTGKRRDRRPKKAKYITLCFLSIAILYALEVYVVSILQHRSDRFSPGKHNNDETDNREKAKIMSGRI